MVLVGSSEMVTISMSWHSVIVVFIVVVIVVVIMMAIVMVVSVD